MKMRRLSLFFTIPNGVVLTQIKKKKPTPAKQRRKLKICEMTYHSKSYSNDIENE